MSLLGFYLFLIFPFFLDSLSNLFMLLSHGPFREEALFKERRVSDTAGGSERKITKQEEGVWEKALRQE